MREIIRITIGLTLTCLVAAVVMGAVFIITDKAKKHNEHLNAQETMLGLLGYGKENPKPADLAIHTFYRYIVEDENGQCLGYVIPVAKSDKTAFELLTISVGGEFLRRLPLELSVEDSGEAPDRAKALRKVLPLPNNFTYADSTIIATLGKERLAYVLPGEFPGFKTFITVMLALDPGFRLLGLEIMEHEEDPGLGGDIEQEFFKNQFMGKTFEDLKDLKVVKEPLPDEYKRVLEAAKWKSRAVTEEDIKAIREKYQEKDIYALTGATISSRSVTSGVKNIVKKFSYRLKILENVIASQNVPVAF